MGVYYYWINHKLNIGVLLGRSISGCCDVEDVEPIFALKNDERFASDLYLAVEERKLPELTPSNVTEILKAASGFLGLTMIDDKYVCAYVLNKLFGAGEIIEDSVIGKYKTYKIYEHLDV